ncbi:MAG: NAD-glutamate dehydrogenase domain-containing protein, partial [Actinomycetes bacterium]
ELDGELDGPGQSRLDHEVRAGVADLRAVAAAADEVGAALAATAARLDAADEGPEWSEAAAFARWVRRHFLVTGVRLPDGSTQGVGADVDPAATVPRDTPVVVQRSLGTSRVHRAERLAVVTFADPAGGPPTQFVGLTSMEGRAERPSGVPWVRQQLAEALRWLSVVPRSHTETVVRTFFDDLPWDVLLVADAAWLAEMLGAMVAAVDEDTTVLRLLPEPAPLAVTAAVAVPEADYRPALDDELAAAFCYLLPVERVETGVELGEGGLVTMSVTALLDQDRAGHALPDDEALRSMAATLRHLARSWPEQVVTELTLLLPGPAATAAAEAHVHWQEWAEHLPPAYRDATPARLAAADLLALVDVRGTGGTDLRLVPDPTVTDTAPSRNTAPPQDTAPPKDNAPSQDTPSAGRTVAETGPTAADAGRELRLVVDGPPPLLSDLVPAVESHGLLSVAETTFVLDGDGPATVLGLLVRPPAGTELTDDGRLAASLRSTLARTTETHLLNNLVVTTPLDHEQVAVLRAYARYLPQLDPTVHPASVVDALSTNPQAAVALWSHVAARFGPADDPDASDDPEGRARMVAACDAVARLDHDRLLRALLTLVDATMRTNLGAPSPGRPVVLKLDGTRLAGLGNRPAWREVWVSAPEVEGIHLRAGPIARGGLRWSDRPDDVRTEVLQLADTQRLKNALIVPTGAKGGFVVRRPPTDGTALRAAVESAYRTFVDALLDVTDNRVDGATVRPDAVRVADGDDSYLVVAADRGTASFSDVANEIAAAHGFWLGDAFASGGSAGYDHKELGVTARGAWVSVAEHFARRGVDVQADRLRVVGIGYMSGDVF